MGDKILITLGEYHATAIRGLGRLTLNQVDFFTNPNDFKLVLFTGGSDVSPELYDDESPKGLCYTNPKRDYFEGHIFRKAIEHEIKMTGICRGAQFLNVMSGGRLMHHIEGHASSIHEMETCEGKTFLVNSLHHQMIVPPEDGLVVGWSRDQLSDVYVGRFDELENWNGPETEAIIIPRTLCCGVQYHPEMMKEKTAGYSYYYNMVKDFLELNMESFVTKYYGKRAEGADDGNQL